MSASTNQAPSLTERFNLHWLHRLLTSSVGRKLVMAATGLLLTGFLVGHLAGNLLLFVGPKAFDEYADWLHHQKWLPLAEAGLLLLFVLHVYLAVATARDNAAARETPYLLKASKQPPSTLITGPAYNWMWVSGALVLGFMILHMVDMKFELRPDVKYSETHSKFESTVAVLSTPLSRGVYAIGVVILGFHLSHGIASAFQSLGLAHPKYTPLVKWLGCVLAILLAAGFLSIPVFVPALRH